VAPRGVPWPLYEEYVLEPAYYIYLLVCSNNVTVLHRFQDITTFTACDTEKAFSFDTSFKIIGHIRFLVRA